MDLRQTESAFWLLVILLIGVILITAVLQVIDPQRVPGPETTARPLRGSRE